MANWAAMHFEGVDEYIRENGVSEINEFFKEKLDRYQNEKVKIGITGDSGAGKSSYINAIRGLKGDDEGAAKVGITETTLELTCYDHPTNPNIKYWDLPGIGSPKYPDLETYCKIVQLETYDAFLIFTNNRITDNDKKLAKKILSIDKRFFFIRAKIDENFYAEEKSKRRPLTADAMKEKIKRDCLENLVDEDGKQLSNEHNIFLINNLDPATWEFDRLTQAILDALPKYQRSSLILSLGNKSTDALQRKVQVLKERLWMVASLSAAAALPPIPGASIAADVALIMKEIRLYSSQLGLPDEGSPIFAILSVDTQREVKAISAMLTSVTHVRGLVAAYGSELAAEEVTRCIPFAGLLAAGAMSFVSTYLFLKHCLQKMEKTALLVLNEVLKG